MLFTVMLPLPERTSTTSWSLFWVMGVGELIRLVWAVMVLGSTFFIK